MLSGFVLGDRGLGAAGDSHPAWMMAHAVADPYLVVGASAVGQIHLAHQLPRDDAFIIRAVGPWLAVAVADGLGSRPFSRYGASYSVEALTSLLLRPFGMPRSPAGEAQTIPDRSKLAPPARLGEADFKPVMIDNLPVERIPSGPGLIATIQARMRKADTMPPLRMREARPEELRHIGSLGWWPVPALPARARLAGAHPPDPGGPGNADADEPNLLPIVREAFEKTHLGLRQHASSLDLDLADLGCTALALLLNVQTGRGAVGQIGDGAMLGLTAQGQIRELVEAPDTGDPQATYTLNRPNFAKYLAVDVIDQPTSNPYVAFYIMTDGLSGDLLYAAGDAAEWAGAVDRNLRVSASPAQAAAGLLNWLATYQVKGSWDDRTLVVITQKERANGDRPTAAGQP
jgi:hypothetical protein